MAASPERIHARNVRSSARKVRMEASVGAPRARSRPASWHSQGAGGADVAAPGPVAGGEPARQAPRPRPPTSSQGVGRPRRGDADPEGGTGVDLHDVMVGEQAEVFRRVSDAASEGTVDGRDRDVEIHPAVDGASRGLRPRRRAARRAGVDPRARERRPSAAPADASSVTSITTSAVEAACSRRPPSGSSEAPIVATTARPARSAPVRTSGSRCGRVSTTTGVLRSPPGSTSPWERPSGTRTISVRTPTVTRATAWNMPSASCSTVITRVLGRLDIARL